MFYRSAAALVLSFICTSCGSEPASGWGFGEGPRGAVPVASLVASALVDSDVWRGEDLSDHSTTTTRMKFAEDGDLRVDWQHWDLFLDEQPAPRNDVAGTWSVGEFGEVTYEHTMWRGYLDRETRTWAIVPPALSVAMGRESSAILWSAEGYLAQDREYRWYHHAWSREGSFSTDQTWVDGAVSVDVRLNAALPDLIGRSDCRAELTFTVDRPDEVGEVVIDEPCVVRREGDGAASFTLKALDTESPSEAWAAILVAAGAERFERGHSEMRSMHLRLWFLEAAPHMLSSDRLWNALVSEPVEN